MLIQKRLPFNVGTIARSHPYENVPQRNKIQADSVVTYTISHTPPCMATEDPTYYSFPSFTHT